MDAFQMLSFSNHLLFALLTCFLAFGGSIVGMIAGGLKGQTTETGLLRGAAVGCVTGAITVIQLMDSPFSKAALLRSLVDGKVFSDWVSPALLKAYQFQMMSAVAVAVSVDEYNSLREISDIFDVSSSSCRGMSQESINMLPKCKLGSTTNSPYPYLDTLNSCSICLQDFKNGDTGRSMPICSHLFHLKCIDEWLCRQGSCPICRNNVVLIVNSKLQKKQLNI